MLDRTPSSIEIDDRPQESAILVVESNRVARTRARRAAARRPLTARCSPAPPSMHARSRGCTPVRAVVLGALEQPRGALDLLEEIRRGCRVGYQLDRSGTSVCRRSCSAQALASSNCCAPSRPVPMTSSAAPVSYLELRARLRALLRRAEDPVGHSDRVRVGPLEIDTARTLSASAELTVELCRLEYELLVHLARKPTTVCSKQELLRAIWNRRTEPGARTRRQPRQPPASQARGGRCRWLRRERLGRRLPPHLRSTFQTF